MKLIRRETYLADTAQLCQIRTMVREVCQSLDFCGQDINAIAMAIDEVCSNIIRYAYEGAREQIIVEIYHNDCEAIFRIQDFAKCVDEASLEVKDKSLLVPGGLGLKIIHHVMDSVQLLPTQGTTGNTLELKKNI